MSEWQLVASSGRSKLSGLFLRRSYNEAGAATIVASVKLAGEFWPRDSKEHNKDLMPDFEVKLAQVILTASLVEDFLMRLEQWSNNPGEISVDLADKRGNDQSFLIILGSSEKVISSKDKPV